jgi:signal peptidase
MGNASNLLLDLTTELLSRGTTVHFRPTGRSMYPSIREGELITVEPVAASDVKLADIVLYRSERGLIAHRVVEIASRDSQVFRLRGDASLSCDQPVEAEQILGRVVSVQRNGSSITLASRGAKLWHMVRRLASGLKGWIYPVGTGSHPDLDFLGEPLTVVEGQLH